MPNLNQDQENFGNRKNKDEESLDYFINKYFSYESQGSKGNQSQESSSPQKQANEPEHETTAKRIGLATLEKPKPGDDLKNKHAKHNPIKKPGIWLLLFGVFLPFMAMYFECNSHFMAKEFFDPFPTFNHCLLFAFIPVSNLFVWLAARTNINAIYSITSLMSGMAVGIALLYSLMLLPLTPIFFLVLPLGLLGLSPLISIPFTFRAGNTLCAIAGRHDTFFDPHQFKHLGHLIVLVMVISVELPSTLTRVHLSDAVQANHAKSQEAINWLRTYGSKEVLLRACYERSGRATDLLGSLYEHQRPVSINKARDIYYKVTGIAFNAVAIPSSFRSTIQHNGLINDPARLNKGAVDEFDLDPDIAGEMVQGVARGLSVTDSSIKGSLFNDKGYASIDWNFNFSNVSKVPREARAKILLPPNACVSRATMWIDGIEKEAKITGRSRARAIYQRAVKTHKRDPLLVSMQGKDVIMVQCYPVLKGSDTRVRLHIIAPLRSNGEKNILSLPMFAERNFGFEKAHNVNFIASENFTITNTNLNPVQKKSRFQLNGAIDNSLLSRAKANLIVKGGQTASSFGFNSELNKKPEKLTVVIDKSITMRPYIEKIESGLKKLPTDMKVYLIEIGDNTDSMLTKNIGEPEGNNYAISIRNKEKVAFAEALELLKMTPCEGGRVNSGTLRRLLIRNKRFPDTNYGDILWIHASQPVIKKTDKTTISYCSKSMKDRIFDLQVASGPNALFDKSSMVKNYVRVPRSGDIEADIVNLVNLWNKPSTSPDSSSEESADQEFNQLKTYKTVLDKFYANDVYGASDLAVANHLISPVTSAVVTDEILVAKYENALKKAPRQVAYCHSVSHSSKSWNPLGKAIDKAFESTVNQLNSLSTAAGSASGGSTYQDRDRGSFYSRADSRKSRESSIYYKQEAQKEIAKQDLEAKMSVAPAAKDMVSYSRRNRGKASYGQSYDSPELQGATNGTVGPQGPLEGEEKVQLSSGFKKVPPYKKAKRKYRFSGNNLPASLPIASDKNFKGNNKERNESSAMLMAAKRPRSQQVAGEYDQFTFGDEEDVIAFGADDASEIKELKKEAKLNSKGEVVPEPEDLPMIFIALLVLACGVVLSMNKKTASETK